MKSKEQTPIEQIIKKINVVANAGADVVDYVNRNKEWFLEIEQKQINSKVLEALERAKTQMESCFNDTCGVSKFDYELGFKEAIEIIETEVKPKYHE